MKQRQPRLGDVLDDYCPRERRLTNHVVVAMVGADIKQTRCTTCEAEHEYKHAKLPRQRRKSEPAALYTQVLASAAPKRVAHEPSVPAGFEPAELDVELSVTIEGPQGDSSEPVVAAGAENDIADRDPAPAGNGPDREREIEADGENDDGPVHRPLIRAQLPRQDQGPSRPFTDFTIRQPGGRPGRFRPRHPHGGAPRGGPQKGNVAGGSMRGGSRPLGGRPPTMPHSAKRHSPGRKRSK